VILSAPRVGARSWRRGAVHESMVILLAALVYAGVRVLTEGSRHKADDNGRRLLHLERALHLDWEGAVQSPVLEHRSLTTLVNWDYIWGSGRCWRALRCCSMHATEISTRCSGTRSSCPG
jgi:hypothetical protein